MKLEPDPARTSRLISLLLLTVTMTILLFITAQFFRRSVAAIRYPYELDYGEGQVLLDTLTLMNGGSIYDAPDSFPFTVSNYPPVYHVLAAALSSVTGAPLASGRALSALSTLLAGAFVGLIVMMASTRGRPTHFSPAAAAASTAAAMLFVSVWPVFIWGVFMRVDMLAILFSLAGLWAHLRWHAHPVLRHVCVALFLLAVFTRQAAVAGAASAIITTFVVDRRRGLRMGAAFCGAVIAISAVIYAATHGQFYFHTVTATATAFHWAGILVQLWYPLAQYRWLTLLAALGAIIALRSRESDTTSAGEQLRLAVPAYMVVSFLVSLTSGKVGSNINYVLELIAGACMVVGMLVGRILQERPPGWRAWMGPAAMIILLIQIVTPSLTPRLTDWWRFRIDPDTSAGDRALDRLRYAEGPVFSEDTTLLVLAGRPIEYQCYELTQLSLTGHWDQRPLLERFNRHDFALVLLRFDIADPTPLARTRFTPEMLVAIRENYRPVEKRGPYWFLVPSVPGAVGRRASPGVS
ncbi:MAG: hypothetical protein HYX75_06430 [Acidobacteria bacterium]|nr:hypothetical protein [Acidobacteriota bacterium]